MTYNDSVIYLIFLLITAYVCLYVEKIPVSTDRGKWAEIRAGFWEVSIKWLLLVAVLALSVWLPGNEAVKVATVVGLLILAMAISHKFGLAGLGQAATKAFAGAGALYCLWLARHAFS